ncbi:MAG: diguanylate cyclase [Solirubrobacteraceae bacterium]
MPSAPPPAGVRRLPVSPARTAEAEYVGGWLCPDKADLARLTDMSPAVRRARLFAGLFAGLGIVVMTPWVNWWLLVLFAVAAGPLVFEDRFLRRARRPERVVVAALGVHSALILAGVALSGGVRSPILPWIAIPAVTAAARFRLPVFLIGAAIDTAGLVLAAALSSVHVLLHDPSPVIGTVVLLGALVVAQQPLLDAELRWRRDAVLDPLTGLLNRQGLSGRFREVAEQARLKDAPVALVMCDLDGFKALNDEHGHSCGDAVLTDVSYALRKELRSFELLYRIGGEELLLVLPGADVRAGCQVAEQVRATIERCCPGGLLVTASLGVCSALADQIRFEAMFEAADRALYEAKRLGRNRVAYVSGLDERALPWVTPAPVALRAQA